MIETKRSDDFADFLSFFEKCVGSNSARDREGAPSRVIEEFSGLVNLPLPGFYLQYLLEFGVRDPVLKMADDTDARVSSLVDFYREQSVAEESESLLPPNAIVIGAFGVSGERALVYSTDHQELDRRSLSTLEPKVAVCENGEIDYFYAQDFRNHIYRQAFIRGRFNFGALLSLRRNDQSLLPTAGELIEKLGFHQYWFSDGHQVCLERESGEVMYVVTIPGRTSIYGCFEQTKTRDQVKQKLCSELELVDSLP